MHAKSYRKCANEIHAPNNIIVFGSAKKTHQHLEEGTQEKRDLQNDKTHFHFYKENLQLQLL